MLYKCWGVHAHVLQKHSFLHPLKSGVDNVSFLFLSQWVSYRFFKATFEKKNLWFNR